MIDYHSVVSMIKSVASDATLKLLWINPKDPCQDPRTNKTTIWVEMPQIGWSYAKLCKWFDTVFHEIGHHLDVCADVFIDRLLLDINMNSPRGMMLNLVDDSRNDKLRCRKYYGMMKYYTLCAPDIYRKIGSNESWRSEPLDPFTSMMKVMLPYDILARSIWSPQLIGTGDSFIHAFTSVEKVQFEKLLSGNLFEEYISLSTGREEIAFVDKVMKDIFDFSEEEKKEEDKEKEPSKDGEPSEEDGNEGDKSDEDGSTGKEPPEKSDDDDSEDSDSGSSKPTESSSDSESSGDVEVEEKLIVIDYADMCPSSDHRKSREGRGSMIKISYDKWKISSKYGQYTPHTDETTKIINLHKLPETVIGGRAWAEESEVDKCLTELNVGYMTSKASKLLQIKTRTTYEYNKKRGKIHGRKLHRVYSQDATLQSRVFKSKVARDKVNCALALLSDTSGSMSRRNKVNVCYAAAIGISALCKTLHVNLEVAAFTEYDKDCNAYIICQQFGKPLSKDKLKRNLITSSQRMYENADGDSILVAYNRILKQPQKKKVIVVLSDGSPQGKRGDAAAYTSEVIKQIEADPRVDILAIGILDDNVKHFYTHHYSVDDLTKLPEALINTLKSCVINS